MKKLGKEVMETRKEVLKKLDEAFDNLGSAVDTFNDKVATEWNAVEEAQNAYNEVLNTAKDWCEGVVTQIDDYVGEKSEKWQEGEKAEAYENWKREYEDVDLTESELSQPDELSIEVENPCETIEGLPEEVES